MEYVAKVMQIKHGRTITEKVFRTLEDAKSYLAKYRSRHKYARGNYTSRITELDYNSIIRCLEFNGSKWVYV